MALIEVRGYVNKPETKGSNRKFATFTLAEKQKGRDGVAYKVFYSVADFNTETPPAESSYVKVKGYLNVRTTEKDGKRYTNLDISAKEIEVAPPRGDAAEPKGGGDDTWDF